MILEGKKLGFFGQIHPIIASQEDIKYNLFLFELNLEQIIISSTRKNNLVKRFRQYPIVPAMERDISVIVEKSITSDSIKNQIVKQGKPLIELVELIDIYKGSEIGEESISLTYRLRYRKENDTLKEDEIAPVHTRIIESLNKVYNARLRQ